MRMARRNGKLATVNENHARELLELHTVSQHQDIVKKMSFNYPTYYGWMGA